MAQQPQKSAYDSLPTRHRVFVDVYIRERWNATAAAREAGYAHPEVRGCELVRNRKVRAAIDERLAEYKLGANETMVRLSEHAAGTMADFIAISESGDARLDLAQARDRGKLHLIRRFKTTTRKTTLHLDDGDRETVETTVEVELYSAQAALEDLAKHHGQMKERVEIESAGGGVLVLPKTLTPEEYAEAVWRAKQSKK